MGLDGVELVMETEECFHITITDDEAGNVITVGDLYNIVLKKINIPHQNTCFTSHTFYRLRSSIYKSFKNINFRIHPKTTMDSIIPTNNRRANWFLLSDNLQLKLPSLERPSILVTILSVITILALSISILGGCTNIVNPSLAWSLGLGSILFAYLSYELTIPFAVNLPLSCQTVGKTAGILLPKYYYYRKNKPCLNYDDVWSIIKSIVAEQVGVDQAKISKESRFIDDLGLS